MKEIIWGLVSFFIKAIFKCRLIKPRVIVRVDGGICSQMHQYLLGEYMKKKWNVPVYYDLTFFKISGLDANGIMKRNFDLLKLFPNLCFAESSGILNKLIMYIYVHKTNKGEIPFDEWSEITPPIFLGEYYKADPLYVNLFRDIFAIDLNILSDKERKFYNSISSIDSVAVHVRRGDLSQYMEGYGYPSTVDYFVKAIQLLYEKGCRNYYFFSDDYHYVKNEIIPFINSDIKIHYSDNDSDRGYVDLVYISKCRHQITSKGSLGKFGALLGMDPNKIVVLGEDDSYLPIFRKQPCSLLIL